MALQISGKRSKLLSNVTTTFVAIFALLLQPMVALNLPAAFAAGPNVHTTDMSNWYLGETRTSGHNQLVSNGLHVWTDSNDSLSKAAGYYGTPGLTLAEIDSTAINFASFEDGRPSVQIGVDRDGNGTQDGYLVYEPWAGYGEGNYWVDKPNFGVPAGGGYMSMGTLAQYKTANPDAKVMSIGYSLGSGVKGDAVISSIVIGNTTYTFGLPAPIAPTTNVVTPSEGGVVATKPNGNNLRVTGTFTDDKAVNYLQLELVRAGNLVTVYTMHYNNPGLQSNGSFDINMPVPADLASGDYSLFYTGTDFDGGAAERKERKFVIDNTAPVFSVTNIAEGDLVGLNSEGKLVVTGNFNDSLSGANYIQTQLVYKGNDKGVVTKHGAIENGVLAEYDAANLVDGTEYYIAVTATDVVGNVSERKIINFTLDKTKPNQVQNLKLSGDNSPISNNSTTRSYAVTASWDRVSDANKYEYCYWNDIAASIYREANCYTTYPTTESQSGVLNQGEGMHHFKVRAIDAAGNKGEWSTTFNVVYLENDAKVNGENFNTYSGSDYQGISVGFNIENFKNVTDVIIGLYREGDTTPFVTNSGTQKLLDLINVDGVKQLSTPFVISPAGYADEYWNLGTHAWTKNDRPVRAKVTVTGTNNADQTAAIAANLSPLTEPDGVTFEGIAPATTPTPLDPVSPVTPNTNTPAGVPGENDTINNNAGIAGRASVFQTGDLAFLAPGENTNRSEVLGSKDSDKKGEVTAKAASSEVLGDSDSDGCYKIFGLCWYWWIPIVAAVAAIIWFIKKLRDEDNGVDSNAQKLS